MRRFVVLALLAGCYNPSVTVGGACSELGECPAGQHCYGNRCLTSPPVDDADVDVAIDVPDGTPIDAPKDAAIDAPPDAPPDAFVSLTWLTPTAIPGINTASGETDPSFTPDRKTIVFSRSGDLQIGTRASTAAAFTVTALAALNTASDEQSPEISADGLTIWFTSDRLVAGSHDVYRSVFSGGAWQAPTLIAELNTASDEADVAVSPDGLTAVIARSGALHKATRATTASLWGTTTMISTAGWGTNPASPSINGAGDVYFHAGTTRDLIVARKMGASYATPAAITELNTATRDAAPFVSSDDLFMYFEHDADLFETHR